MILGKLNKDETIKSLSGFISDKCLNAKPLLLVIKGSQAYGTNTPESDIDFSGIYIQDINDIITGKYVPHLSNQHDKEIISDDKNKKDDKSYFEIQRFLELLQTNNPAVLDLLYTPEDCIIYKHPLMDNILQQRDKFLSKRCSESFAGFATQQRNKAMNMDKMIHWEQEKIERKSPIDFLYLMDKEKTYPVTEWLDILGLDQKFCGLSKVSRSHGVYTLYYDYLSHSMDYEKKPIWLRKFNKKMHKLCKFLNVNTVLPMRFKGIGLPDSNHIKVSAIPKDVPSHYFKGYVYYNEQDYKIHCKAYNKYQTWLEERNTARWVDVKSHGQKIDGKNLMHYWRIVKMANELAETKTLNIRRTTDREYLLSIRKGEVDLQTIIDQSEAAIQEFRQKIKMSDLPEEVDGKFIDRLLLEIRKGYYQL